MPSRETCRREIESLHGFFVAWYAGEVGMHEFERLESALADDFEMVTPEGVRRQCDAVLEEIRDNYARREDGGFRIDVRNVDVRWATDEYALVRYEEWQQSPEEATGRLSTVLFESAPAAPGKVRWLDLHETWLDAPTATQA